jgi:endonuclease-3 related protein
MPSLDKAYPELRAALAACYGTPSTAVSESSPWERLLCAALERTSARSRVERAIEALGEAGLLEPAALAKADPLEVEQTLEESRAPLPRAAIHLLRKLGRWLLEAHGGSIDALDRASTDTLREALAAIGGVGPATADAILLFGMRRPVFPVSRASFRILARHGWLEPWADYEAARATLEGAGPQDADHMEQLAIWLERVGRDACGQARAKCERCPLRPFLPEGGVCEIA